MPYAKKIHRHTPERIIEAQERGAVDINLHDIINADGTLHFLEEAQNRGLVEIRQTKTKLHLKIGGVVGHLPLTTQLALNIRPKFPISNLARMVSLSNHPLNKMMDLARFYNLENNVFFPEALIKGFAYYCRAILETGLQKQYYSKIFMGSPRPKIDLKQSQQKYWAHGNHLKAVSNQFVFGPEVLANQILKTGALIAVKLIEGRTGFRNEKNILVAILDRLHNVQVCKKNELNTSNALEDIASFRSGYQNAIPIAIELIKNTNLNFSNDGKNIELPSFLLNLDDIFETYIRNILELHLSKNTIGHAYDGNKKKWSRNLLKDSNRFKVKPDLVILSHQRQVLAVGDTKYKGKQIESDRYQIISHALAYEVDRAILIYPATRQKPSGLLKLGTIGPPSAKIELSEYYFSLSNDLVQEEQLLFKRISAWLSSPPK